MSQLRSGTGRMSREAVTLTLVALSAVAWWLTSILSTDMGVGSMATPMSLGSFVLAWGVMMAAMMLPAVTPVVRLYQRAAAAGRVAPSGYFVVAYLTMWVLSGVPAYLLWRVLAGIPEPQWAAVTGLAQRSLGSGEPSYHEDDPSAWWVPT
jgi:predicted metal-binding membrane protein